MIKGKGDGRGMLKGGGWKGYAKGKGDGRGMLWGRGMNR